MLDETSPYIAGWFAATVLTLMLLKYIYLGQGLGEQGEAEVMSIFIIMGITSLIIIVLIIMVDQQAVYQSVLSLVKPSVTLATGLFCCAIHAYVYDLRYFVIMIIAIITIAIIAVIFVVIREESWFVLGCVMAISLLLAGLELLWSLQVILIVMIVIMIVMMIVMMVVMMIVMVVVMIVIMIVMVGSMTRKVTKWHVSGSDGPLLLHHLLASELLHSPPLWNDWKALPRILKTFCNISQSFFQQFSILSTLGIFGRRKF